MKFIYCILLAALISCNQEEKTVNNDTAVPDPLVIAKAIVPDDPITAKLRTAITTIETGELQSVSKLRGMFIDSLRYQMVSMKDYYTIQKKQLAASAHLSTNKEKTNNALAYLDKMTAASSTDTVIYKVQFHLNASLTNNINYNEGHTKYLKEDLSEVKIIFP